MLVYITSIVKISLLINCLAAYYFIGAYTLHNGMTTRHLYIPCEKTGYLLVFLHECAQSFCRFKFNNSLCCWCWWWWPFLLDRIELCKKKISLHSLSVNLLIGIRKYLMRFHLINLPSTLPPLSGMHLYIKF